MDPPLALDYLCLDSHLPTWINCIPVDGAHGSGRAGVGAGPGGEERSGPIGSQNAGGFELWEGHQSPLMGLQVWQAGEG